MIFLHLNTPKKYVATLRCWMIHKAAAASGIKWRFVSAKSVKNICVWNVCSNYNLYERVFVDIEDCVRKRFFPTFVRPNKWYDQFFAPILCCTIHTLRLLLISHS